MMIRTFIALEIPKNVLDFTIDSIRESVKSFDKIRWEKEDKLHLTLKFIGNFEESNIEYLIKDLNLLLEDFPKLDLQLNKFGFFIKDNIPKILWLGLKENENLYKLVMKIDELTSQYRIEREKRKFKPHITLLRIKDLEYINELNTLKEIKFENVNFIADKIHLFKSELLKTGSVYKSLKEFQLK